MVKMKVINQGLTDMRETTEMVTTVEDGEEDEEACILCEMVIIT